MFHMLYMIIVILYVETLTLLRAIHERHQPEPLQGSVIILL